MRDLVEKATYVILTLSAAAIATTLVHREFFAQPAGEAVAPQPPEYIKRWNDLLPGAVVMGDTHAPVTIVEFMDLECPFCKTFNSSVQVLRKKYGAAVTVAVVHYPLGMHRFARPAARAATCAHAQGRFEHFVNVVYDKQDSLGFKSWTSYATDAGVPDTAAFLRCATATTPVASIDTGVALAKAIGVNATPTILVNGWRYSTPPDSAELDRVVRAILARKRPFDAAQARGRTE
jgi:protein-disulfide isomerase